MPRKPNTEGIGNKAYVELIEWLWGNLTLSDSFKSECSRRVDRVIDEAFDAGFESAVKEAERQGRLRK